MTTYYVSSQIGNDNNAGTCATAPLATLQVAANLVHPGDTVEVMNGTYTGPAYGDVLDITTSGTASAPITFEAAPGQTPIIDSSDCWNAINIKASYIIIRSEEHTSELQSRRDLVCRLLLEKKKKKQMLNTISEIKNIANIYY